MYYMQSIIKIGIRNYKRKAAVEIVKGPLRGAKAFLVVPESAPWTRPLVETDGFVVGLPDEDFVQVAWQNQ
jgi:hypothetical protein